MADTKLVNLLDVIVETTGATLPEGCDSWGLKSTAPDLVTPRGFQWPFPGGSVRSDDDIDLGRHLNVACPNRPGDGLCIATTWRGMASGGHPARTLLLVSYSSADVLGTDEVDGKLRVKGLVRVVALINGEQIVKTSGSRANLSRANLSRANLSGADLSGADLTWADLPGADLTEANLSGANLTGADLSRADLSGANLTEADLSRADLTEANLTEADLYGARSLELPAGWKLTDSGIAVRSCCPPKSKPREYARGERVRIITTGSSLGRTGRLTSAEREGFVWFLADGLGVAGGSNITMMTRESIELIEAAPAAS